MKRMGEVKGSELQDKGIIQEVFRLLEEGDSVGAIAGELELPKKDIEDIYEKWKQEKMDNLEIGDRVCFILDIAGYESQLVHGKIYSKHTNAVVVDCRENKYVNKQLKGRVAVSVKDILKS